VLGPWNCCPYLDNIFI